MNEIPAIIEVILYANLAAFAIFVGLNLHRWTGSKPERKNRDPAKKIP